MSALAMIDMERQQSLDEAHWEYQEAFDAMMDYQAAHDINRRTLAEIDELSRLTSICESKKYAYEIAKMQRYKVVI